MASSDTEFIQSEQVANLRRSKKIVGELQPIVIDKRTNRIVAGSHRKLAGWKSVEYVTTKDDLEFWRLKMHGNVQRSVPMNEFASLLITYGKVMEASGLDNRAILKELLEVSPFNIQYTYEFIPAKYKTQTKEGKPFGRPTLGNPKVTSGAIKPSKGEPPVDFRQPDEHFFKQHKCPSCGAMLRITATGLEIV